MRDGGERLLLLGGLPWRYLRDWEITSDLSVAARKLGVTFDNVSCDELRAQQSRLGSSGLTHASEMARQLVGDASESPRANPPPMTEVEKATILYVAMRKIMEERHSDGVTINCGEWARMAAAPVPCVALMCLQEEGLPAACQGDVDALLTMVLVRRVSGLAGFMGGAVEIEDHLGVSHCVLSRRMLGSHMPAQSYYLAGHHRVRNSPTIHTSIPKGEIVTIARLTRNVEGLLLATGEVVGNEDREGLCRNTVVIAVANRARAFASVKGVQQHYVVACGDHTEAMARLADRLGIEVIGL